jgi:thiol-disulfide isomerase/thioredoxin
VVVFLAAMVMVQSWQTKDVPSGLAPDFEIMLAQADGEDHTLSFQSWRARHPGQAVVLHFWADWCPICRTEENSITRLGADWPVLTVAMQSGTPEHVRQVLQQRQLPWNTALDNNGDITKAYGFKAVPAFVVVDANGQLRTPTTGYTSEIGMRLRLWWVMLWT